MSTVRRRSIRKPSPPVTWPSWTDRDIWQISPTPDDAGPYEPPSDEDRLWAAEHLNDDVEVIPDNTTLEELAEMHAAMARMERGLKD